jgi:hypothetical protein
VESHRERINEFELRVKKLEQEKIKIEQDQSKSLRDKDSFIEEMKRDLYSIDQVLKEKDYEVTRLVAYQKDLQQKL